MTKEEAKQALREGKKLTHRYFSDNEYIYAKGNIIFSEDGVNHGFDFWNLRPDEWWNDGWEIFVEK